MGVTAGHSADDEANVLKQMSLHPLNAELSSGTSRLLEHELQKGSNCVCVSVDVWMWGECGHKRSDKGEGKKVFWSVCIAI